MTPTPALYMNTYTLTHTALGSGRLCLCSFPGSKMSARTSDQSKAAFRHDLEAMYALGMTDMIGLVEPDEYRQMGLVSKDDTDSMPGVFLKSMPVKYLNMPIRDYDIPNNIFLTEWRLVLSYYASVTHGGNILGIHCMGGRGRSGMVAAMFLIGLGVGREESIRAVRSARPGAIENEKQEGFVRTFSLA
jgi:ADP-ribosyl-[dinitrogen reductase] hydrolase